MAELRYKIRQLEKEIEEYEIIISGAINDTRARKNGNG